MYWFRDVWLKTPSSTMFIVALVLGLMLALLGSHSFGGPLFIAGVAFGKKLAELRHS